jgi:hypothetical protein
MFEHGTNLIRGMVPPARKRKLLWLAVSACLLVYGILGVVALATLGRDITQERRQAKHLASLEREALNGNTASGADELVTYLRGLESLALEQGGDIRMIATMLATRPDPARVLAGVAAGLPSGGRLARCDFAMQDDDMVLDLTVSSQSTTSTVTPSRLIERWQEHPLLADRLAGLTAEASQTRGVGTNAVQIWQFKAVVKGEGL